MMYIEFITWSFNIGSTCSNHDDYKHQIETKKFNVCFRLFSQETQQKQTIAEKDMAHGEICFSGKCYHHCIFGKEGNTVLKKQSF